MRSESTLVPPVTAQRSPPLSRMTGADSPVMADSSTEAIPSTTSPSPGMSMPASTTTRSPFRSVEASTSSSRPFTTLRACVSCRIFRSDAACALPRPSAIASAKLAKTTVNHSQALTSPVNQSGGAPAGRTMMSRTQRRVVRRLPTSTTNMTGFFATCAGVSLRKLSATAGPRIVLSNSESCRVVVGAISRPCL